MQTQPQSVRCKYHPNCVFVDFYHEALQASKMCSILGSKHDHIFPCGLAELDEVLVLELQVSAVWNFLRVEHRPIGAFEVNQVGLDLANLIAIFVSLLQKSELDDSVLLANTRMLSGNVNDGHFPANEPACPRVQLNRVNDILPLEHEQLPLVLR